MNGITIKEKQYANSDGAHSKIWYTYRNQVVVNIWLKKWFHEGAMWAVLHIYSQSRCGAKTLHMVIREVKINNHEHKKWGHLTYVGDADIRQNINSCGVVLLIMMQNKHPNSCITVHALHEHVASHDGIMRDGWFNYHRNSLPEICDCPALKCNKEAC